MDMVDTQEHCKDNRVGAIQETLWVLFSGVDVLPWASASALGSPC